MKMQITHLKAPWPEGAKVGDVFEAGDGLVPAWALGKVKPAEDDAKVTLTLPRRKATEAEQSSRPIEPNTPVAKEQADGETIEQQAQREREELNPGLANGGQSAGNITAQAATPAGAAKKPGAKA